MIRAGLLVFSKQHREKTHYDPLFELFFCRRHRHVLQDQRRLRNTRRRGPTLVGIVPLSWPGSMRRTSSPNLYVPSWMHSLYPISDVNVTKLELTEALRQSPKESPLLIIARLEINAFNVRKHGIQELDELRFIKIGTEVRNTNSENLLIPERSSPLLAFSPLTEWIVIEIAVEIPLQKQMSYCATYPLRSLIIPITSHFQSLNVQAQRSAYFLKKHSMENSLAL